MANPQHAALARRGPSALARWREQQWRRRGRLDLSGAALSAAKLPGVDLARDELTAVDLTNSDLRRADLSGAVLNDAYLSRANLAWANLRDTQLRGASLNRANLNRAQLANADLRGADLSFADFSSADLTGANLAAADLRETNLSLADLTGANLSSARLTGTALTLANLTDTDLRQASLLCARLDHAVLSNAVLEMTLFADCDLSRALGLTTLRHRGPSIIGIDTLTRSRGLLPPDFLRQAGVAESLIALTDRLSSASPDFTRILLVGSLYNAAFIDRLESDLRAAGFACWQLLVDDEAAFTAEESQSPLSRVIYYDRLALVCSAQSLTSPYGWRAFDHIARERADAMLAIALDDRLDHPEDTLAATLRRALAADFRRWPETEAYRQSLYQLTAALSEPAEKPSAGADWPEPIAPPGD